MNSPSVKKVSRDIETVLDLRLMVESFYLKLLQDKLLEPFFDNKLYIFQRMPIITAYWQQLLWGEGWYRRHTMNIHRNLGRRVPFRPEHFERWVALLECTVDEMYAGPSAERVKKMAATVAGHMSGRFAESENLT